MLKSKLRTFIKILKVFGVSQVLRVIIEKFSYGKSGVTDFPETILWQSLGLKNEKKEFLAFWPEPATSAPRSGFFNEIYDLGSELGSFLIKYIRGNSSTRIVETGVAAGRSTALILAELSKQQRGKLDSFDVTDNVGELVSSELRLNWTLHVLPILFRKKFFVSRLRTLSHTQLFLHDSDHSPSWQMFEVREVLKHLSCLEYLLIDDVQPEVAIWLLKEFGPDKLIFLSESGRKKSLVLDCA